MFADLSGDQRFQSACAPIEQGTVLGAGPATLWSQSLVFDYAASSQTYTVDGDGQTSTFGPGDRDPARPNSIAYVKPVPSGPPERFDIFRQRASDVPLDYTRTAILARSRFGRYITYNCIIGVPTVLTDRPTVNNVTYAKTGALGTARVVVASSAGSTTSTLYGLQRSVATIAVDLTTGRVTASLRLVGAPQSGADVELGAFSGTADVDQQTGGFYGSLTTSDRDARGTFSGSFFGPQGREIAFAFEISGRDANAQGNFSAAGTVVGLR